MKVSVIVPVYKVEQYLQRCVDSVLAQSHTDFELILVDDGSPDNCPAMCDEIAKTDSRVRVIHKKNGGLSDARNAGIDVAHGEYLLFVDSDDVIHPDTLYILLTSLEQNNAQIAVGGFERFEGEAPSDGLTSLWNRESQSVSAEEATQMLFEPWLYTHNLVSACCKLFPKCMFDDVRFPVGRLFEDEFTVYKLYAKASKVALVDIKLYFYFYNDDSITGTLTLQKWMDAYDARYERALFFEQRGNVELYDMALMQFLRWAQWDLIKCREGKESVDENRKHRFEHQFKDIFSRARKRKVINVAEHLDYYMLAKPHLALWWRIRRKMAVRKNREQ